MSIAAHAYSRVSIASSTSSTASASSSGLSADIERLSIAVSIAVSESIPIDMSSSYSRLTSRSRGSYASPVNCDLAYISCSRWNRSSSPISE